MTETFSNMENTA